MTAPAFERDIFISYAHIDDESPEGPGWISYLHKWLEVRVAQLSGARPRIWRDPTLQGNEIFSDEIVDNLLKVAFFVSVLSPRYVRSEWCRRELATFSEAAERTGGLRIGNKARIFKVVKTPIPHAEHPGVLQDLLGYDFFGFTDDGRPREYDPTLDETTKKDFVKVLNDLAQDIAGLLDAVQSSPEDDAPVPTGADAAPVARTGPTIFLAGTGYDLKDPREDVKRFLEAEGAHVLPDRPLPTVLDAFRARVDEDLAAAEMAVHMVGKLPGVVPDGGERAVVALQAEMAAMAGRRRLIWMPPGLTSENAVHDGFIHDLKRGRGALEGADLMEGSLEDLKIQLKKMLTPEPAPPEVEGAADATGPGVVYLICDQQDLGAVAPAAQHLFAEGFEVALPAFDGEPAEVRALHEDQLRRADAVLVYYGTGKKPWFEEKLSELRKIFGQGRARPFAAKVALVGEPDTPDKALILTRDADVVRVGGAFTPELLAPLVAAVRELRA